MSQITTTYQWIAAQRVREPKVIKSFSPEAFEPIMKSLKTKQCLYDLKLISFFQNKVRFLGHLIPQNSKCTDPWKLQVVAHCSLTLFLLFRLLTSCNHSFSALFCQAGSSSTLGRWAAKKSVCGISHLLDWLVELARVNRTMKH